MAEPMPRELMQRMMTGYWFSQAIYVAARLRLADCLAERAATESTVLAEATGTAPPDALPRCSAPWRASACFAKRMARATMPSPRQAETAPGQRAGFALVDGDS